MSEAIIEPLAPMPDPETCALSAIDVSDPRLLEQNAWQPYFKRLRAEDPVHYTEDSAFGAYWSITKFDDSNRHEQQRKFVQPAATPRQMWYVSGNRLGEMQLRIVWEEVLKRFKQVEVTGEPERVSSNFVKGYHTLPVILYPH